MSGEEWHSDRRPPPPTAAETHRVVAALGCPAELAAGENERLFAAALAPAAPCSCSSCHTTLPATATPAKEALARGRRALWLKVNKAKRCAALEEHCGNRVKVVENGL